MLDWDLSPPFLDLLPVPGPRTRKPKKQSQQQSGDKTASNGTAATLSSTTTMTDAHPAAAASAPVTGVAANSADSSSACSASATTTVNDDKRPRTAFSGPQLARLKVRFLSSRTVARERQGRRKRRLHCLCNGCSCIGRVPINAFFVGEKEELNH